MEPHQASPEMACLDTADRIARTAYLWLRHRDGCSGASLAPKDPSIEDRHSQLLAAGFIQELCDSLQLTMQHSLLAAYAFALLEGGNTDPLVIARILIGNRTTRQTSVIFTRGRSLAGELLCLLESPSLQDFEAAEFDRQRSPFII